MFVDRKAELTFLNTLLTRQYPGPAQFLLMYGRRRVGKTLLLRHWAENSGLPYTYWTAEKEPGAMQRRKLFAQVDQRPLRQSPLFDTWSDVWQAIAARIGSKKHILVIDELPYAAESDPAMLSSLQHAWDNLFQHSNLILALCGSQVQSMHTLQQRQSPLFGRFTAQWHLQPLPFYTLPEFFPNWSDDERVAIYAILGGVPAYFQWINPNLSLIENLRQQILAPGSLFLGEPMLLLYDELREPQSYLAILKAIGSGAHTLDDISKGTLISKSNLSAYLKRLQDLRFIERRLPATIPQAKRARSRQGRYHISDPYFRFYFRFISPFHDIINFDIEPAIEKIKRELRAFVGQTTFEELAREWLLLQIRSGAVEGRPEHLGSHWSRRVQIDVAGVDRQNKILFLGECKWREAKVDKKTLRELIEAKYPKLQHDLDLAFESEEWSVQYFFFARAGFTEAARAYARAHNISLVNLKRLISVLEQQ